MVLTRLQQYVFPTIGMLIISATAIVMDTASSGSEAPKLVMKLEPGQRAYPVAMPDGEVKLLTSRFTNAGAEIAQRISRDFGHTWTDFKTLRIFRPGEYDKDHPLGEQPVGGPFPLVAENGDLHMFWMAMRGAGQPAAGSFIDLWNVHSDSMPGGWSPSQCCFEGYVGSVNGIVQLSKGPAAGRIVLPFAYWRAGVMPGLPNGNHYVTTIYSDDGGKTWQQSPAKLTTPCYNGYNGPHYGATEPTIIQLDDGRAWMLIRNSTRWLYQSFSPNGSDWSEATPSRFYSTQSPAWLQRLDDGRIILFWNNCENTSSIDGKYVYINRDALHAAISSDDGKTWQGYREVYLDPRRNQTPIPSEDQGTAYPYATQMKDGTILLLAGQTVTMNLLSINPDWLEEHNAKNNFSDGLSRWSAHKPYGPSVEGFRARVQGPQLVPHPDNPNQKVLHVRRPDGKPGDEAGWNFPAGRHGRAEMSILLQPGHDNLCIALADRHIPPSDPKAAFQEMYRLKISADGNLLDGSFSLISGQWYTLAFEWNLDENRCEVYANDQLLARLALFHEEPNSPGLSYLRFRSEAGGVDTEGMLIGGVQAQCAGNFKTAHENLIDSSEVHKPCNIRKFSTSARNKRVCGCDRSIVNADFIND